MSLELSRSNNLNVKTWGLDNSKDIVCLGKYDIEINDFFHMVYYVLTNTDLYRDDPRLKFIARIKKMKKVTGYLRGSKHLE